MASENDPIPPESEMPPTPASPDENVLPSQLETQVPLDENQMPPPVTNPSFQESVKENVEESAKSNEMASKSLDENQPPSQTLTDKLQELIKENLKESPKLNGQQENGSKMCRALFMLKHTNGTYRQIKKVCTFSTDTKVYDAIDHVLSNVDWPKNQQYVIDLVCNKNGETVSKNEVIGDKKEYSVTVSNFQTTAFLKINDGQFQQVTVSKEASVFEFIVPFVESLSSPNVIEKYDTQFKTFIDCSSDELVEEGAHYQVQVETQIEEVQLEIGAISEIVESVEIVHVQEETVLVQNIQNIQNMTNFKTEEVVEEKFVDAPKFQPVDETKNIKRIPNANAIQIGALYDLADEHIQINGNLSSLDNFNSFVIDDQGKPELKSQFYKDVRSFSSRCEHLGIRGIEKITAMAYMNTALYDYLTATIQEDLCYFAVVLTCTANTHKLDVNNETLRHKLSAFQFGNTTHLLTSITKGINYVVLMGFPTFAVHNIGANKLEKVLTAFFNSTPNEDYSILQIKDIQIDIFTDTYQNAKSNASFLDVKELLYILTHAPTSIAHKFTDISLTLTPLDQFQPGFTLKKLVDIPEDLMNQATDLLANIHDQLNEHKSLSKQIDKYMRVFGNAECDKWFEMTDTKKKSLQDLGFQVFQLVLRHRKDCLTELEFREQLNKCRFQSTNGWSSTEANLLNYMKEKIREVKDVEKLELEFVGTSLDFLAKRVYGPLTYVLAYKDKTDQEYRSNLEHLLSLPSHSKRLLLDQNLLKHQAIPNDYTCILKFEDGRLVDQNVLRSHNFRQRSSVARCPRVSLREDLTPKDKNSILEIPCPSCNDADCFWLCDRCLDQLQYDWSGYFYCKCGMAPVEVFEYSCKNYQKHGSEYTKYQHEALKSCLKRLRASDDKVILMLGQTGVGKSTFINALFNYFTFSNLDEAIDGEPFTVIPSSFTVLDEHFQQTRVVVGEESEDERFVAGESATKIPKIYSLSHKSSKLIFIDTPGIADSNGSGTDKENMEMILNCIAPYKNIHGICVLLKPNESRLTLEFEYCIGELFTHLHRSVTKNLLFCLTNTQGTFYRPGETKTTLEAFFSKLEQSRGIHVQLTKDNIFCMDSCAFRYLCARHQGIKFDDTQHEINSFAWEKSASETQRLVQCITNIEPHSTTKTITLNDVRRKILSLSKPLAEATKACQYNIDVMEMQEERLRNLTGEEQDLKDRLQIQKFHSRQRELGHPRTVCTGPDCMTVKTDGNGQNVQVFERHCHERCYLKGVSVGVYPNTALLNCWAMNGTENCRGCKCSWSTHLHVTWEVVEEWLMIEDENARKNLDTLEARRSQIEQAKRKCKKLRDRYETEKKTIYKIGAELAIFLQQNALVPYNDAIIDYLNHEIKRAKMEATVTLDNAKVDALEKALSEYLEEKAIIKNFADKTKSGKKLDVSLSLEDVHKRFNKLCNLPFLGKSIKEMMDAELNGQRKQMEFHQGHFNVQEKRSQTNRKMIGMPDVPIFFNGPRSPPPPYTQFLAQPHPSSIQSTSSVFHPPSSSISSSTVNSSEDLPSIVNRLSNQFTKWLNNVGEKRQHKKGHRHHRY